MCLRPENPYRGRTLAPIITEELELQVEDSAMTFSETVESNAKSFGDKGKARTSTGLYGMSALWG